LAAAGPAAFAAARRVWTSTAVVRRETLGGLRFDEGLRTAEDVDLWLRLAAAAPVYLSSERLATAVLEPGSLSRSDAAADAANLLRVIRRHAALLGRGGARRLEADAYRVWAATCLGEGDPRGALGPAWRRACRQPWSPRAWWIVAKSLGWSALTTSPTRKQGAQPDALARASGS
jgi:hypothetical protein